MGAASAAEAEAVEVAVAVAVVVAAVTGAELAGVAGRVEDSASAGFVVVALNFCPWATVSVSTRRIPKGLPRADLFARKRGQAKA